tara:strand:- start:118548 stop:118922 length:375 start_codon:yes stop_codon:yes gene_type:complete
MTIRTVYVIEDNKFGKSITEWTEGKRIEAVPVDQKNNDLVDDVDAIVVFHENHNFSKEDEETHEYLTENNKPGYKVDINGTLAATNSNFTMWLERNRPKSLLILGQDDVAKNPNFKRFLESIGK